MSKEIKLLEEAENLLKTEAFMECSAAERCEECVTKVLGILKQREYDTRTIENTKVCPCGNIFVEADDYDTLGSKSGVCCPSCGNEKFKTVKELIQQPPAGEWTKNLRNFIKLYENEVPRRAEITFLIEACDIIDRAEAELKAKDEIIFAYESVNAPINPLLAINKDLLKACEYSHTLLLRNIGQSTHAVALLEDAIAKAKKEG